EDHRPAGLLQTATALAASDCLSRVGKAAGFDEKHCVYVKAPSPLFLTCAVVTPPLQSACRAGWTRISVGYSCASVPYRGPISDADLPLIPRMIQARCGDSQNQC